MYVLVMNSGSSSIKFSVFETGAGVPRSLFDGAISGVGAAGARLTFEDGTGKDLAEGRTAVQAETAAAAIGVVMELVGKLVSGGQVAAVDAVGYRVVHPGARLKGHQRITEEVLRELEGAAEFAPLHDPEALEVIRTVMQSMPMAAHFACFDTVFHETMPPAATTYALPEEIRARGVKRYGFHGLSCESVVVQIRAAVARGEMEFPRRMVIAHLGSGCSVTAVVDGRSLDTTMGMTPTGGVVMGTRPGDLDPGVMVYLLRQARGGRDEVRGLEAQADFVEGMMNHHAGMVALSGMKNDMKTVREAAAQGDDKALLAVEVFTRSVRKAIGGFCWLMGGVDAIVFAGGIGEHDAASREEILTGLEGVGVELDGALKESKGEGVHRVSGVGCRVAVYVVPAEEDRMIAIHVAEMMGFVSRDSSS